MLTYADISILLQVLICELIALILGVGEEWKGAVSLARYYEIRYFDRTLMFFSSSSFSVFL
jgi:hypothetical protein